MIHYEIYQVDNDNPKGRAFKFMSLDFVRKHNLCTMNGDTCKLDKNLYKKVYEHVTWFPKGESIATTLETIYMMYQGKKPYGYNGHSVSVSDIIVLDDTPYYVNNLGFEKVEF